MENFLTLLESTEDLLKNAEENLNTLNSMKFEEDFQKKIQPLVKKYAENWKVLKEKKKKILGILFQLVIYTSKTYFTVEPVTFGFYYRYHVLSENQLKIDVPNLPSQKSYDSVGTYSVSEFVDKKTLPFYLLCEKMIEGIDNFLANSPKEQLAEMKQLDYIIHQFTSLSK